MATEQKTLTLQFPLEYWELVTEAFTDNPYYHMRQDPMGDIGKDSEPLTKEQVTADSILEFIRIKTKDFVKRKRTEELMKMVEDEAELESKQSKDTIQVKTV